MHIAVDSALQIQSERPGTYEREGMEEGNRFFRAMQHLQKQELGEGWSFEPGNTNWGKYRLSLTLHGVQAAVFDENWSGTGAPARPHLRLHPFISSELALSKFDDVIEIGIRAADRMWDVGHEPVPKGVEDPFEAETSDHRQAPSFG